MLTRLVIAFLLKSKCLLISWLQSPSAVILEPKKIKSVAVSVVFPSVCHEVMGPDAMILVFWALRQLFHSPLSLSSRGSLVLLHFLPLGWCHLYISEKAMAPHSSTLAWKIPWMEEPGGLQSMGSWRVRHDWATSLSLFTFMHWRRKRQPTPVFLPGESQGRGSLEGCHLWGRTELDTTEAT